MHSETVLNLLAEHKPQLQREFGVRNLGLFGSTAQGAATAH
jgi:predicted nucleotidyltransferase